jgi:sulfite exporter TauE/SafE
MMIYSLLITAFLMGLGGVPHCAAMCGAPCAVALPHGLPWTALLGRSLGYALIGALAAGATALLSNWSRWIAVLQPLWVMLLAAAVMLGLWMTLKGAMPSALQQQGLRWYHRVQGALSDSALLKRWPWLGVWMPTILGMAWAALPCGLLYGAVTVAALAPTAWGGAAVMVAFSLPGACALWWLSRRFNAWRPLASGASASAAVGVQSSAVVPVLWLRREGQGGDVAAEVAPRHEPSLDKEIASSDLWWRAPSVSWLSDPRWAVRVSGAMLATAAAWALAHRLMEQWQAWCA